MTAPTVNFASLAAHDAVLVEYAAEAEGLFRGHPRLCVANLRTLAEALAKHAAAYAGIYVGEREELGLLVGRLRDRGVTDGQIGAIVPPPDPTGPDGVAEAEAAELTDYFNARLSPNRLRGINPLRRAHRCRPCGQRRYFRTISLKAGQVQSRHASSSVLARTSLPPISEVKVSAGTSRIVTRTAGNEIRSSTRPTRPITSNSASVSSAMADSLWATSTSTAWQNVKHRGRVPSAQLARERTRRAGGRAGHLTPLEHVAVGWLDQRLSRRRK